MALSRKARTKMNDWLTWFNYHAPMIEAQPLEAQVKWLMKATQGAYECFSTIGQEMNGENRTLRSDQTEAGIIVPGARFR